MIEVTVYTKPMCPQCVFTEQKLDDLGVPYTAVDVTEDTTALEYVQSLGYSSAPVVLVSGDIQHWSGFRPDRLAGLAA
jgi:glutaredoxin-like protein NrdH